MSFLSKRIIKLTSVILAVSLMSFGCNKSPLTVQNGIDYTGTLKIWKPFVDSQQFNALIAAYQQAHPKVQIEYIKKNIENYQEDLLKALASNTGPDIFTIHNSWLPQYLDKTTPAPDGIFTLSDYKNTFLDVVTEDFTDNGKIYGTANSVDTLALYYNKDLLGTAGYANAPKTWDELARQVRNITRQDQRGYFSISGVSLGTGANVNRAQDIVYLFMLQQGVIPASSDHFRPTFAQAVNRNGNTVYPGALGLTYYTSFANPNTSNYTWNSQSDYSTDSFANGRSAMIFGYTYTASTIIQKAPNLRFGIAPVPQVGTEGADVNFANYFGEVVSKQSQHSDLAWDFLKFVTSKDNLQRYNTQYKEVSSRKDIAESQVKDIDIGVFAKAALTAKNFYRIDQARVDAIILKAIDNVVLNGMKPEQAVALAEQQVSSIGQGGY